MSLASGIINRNINSILKNRNQNLDEIDDIAYISVAIKSMSKLFPQRHVGHSVLETACVQFEVQPDASRLPQTRGAL